MLGKTQHNKVIYNTSTTQIHHFWHN